MRSKYSIVHEESNIEKKIKKEDGLFFKFFFPLNFFEIRKSSLLSERDHQEENYC